MVKNLYKKTGAEGFCLQDEPRRYELEIDAFGFRDFITTICHEMVHVKQTCVGNSRKSVVNNTGKVNFATKTTMSNLLGKGGVSSPRQTGTMDLGELAVTLTELEVEIAWTEKDLTNAEQNDNPTLVYNLEAFEGTIPTT